MSTGPDYLGTLFRYACLAVSIALAMALLYRLLRRLNCREQTAAGYSFILPWILGFLIFSLFPMAYSLYLSFTQYGILSAPHWVGLQHYVKIFQGHPVFLDAVRTTVVFALFSVSLGILTSLTTAFLLSLQMKFMGFWRLIYYLPSVIPAVSTALLWRFIFVPEGGLANTILGWLGLPQPGWFSDPHWVIPAFVIMSLQGACGNNMVIFMARLRGIDTNLYEASDLDGAGVWARFRFITLPQISPVIFYHLVTGIIGSLQIFTQPMFITTPGRSGLFYAVYIYRTGWQELRMGYACALSWVLFLAVMILTLMVFRSARYWVSYEQSDILPKTGPTALGSRPFQRRSWYTIVVLGGFVMLIPILWMVATSLKSSADVFAMPPKLLSFPLQWRNYLDAWLALPFWRFLFNTVFISALAVVGEVFGSALVAYGFSRFNFPGRRILFAVLLSTLMIPTIVTIIPMFLIWRSLGLIGTFDPLVLGSLLSGSALFVFISYQFFKTLPGELEEAARLDGASYAGIFFRIILPLAKPVLFVNVLISFQAHWNDFLRPLLYLNQMDHYTMTMGLQFFQGAFMGEAPMWHWMMAITTLMSIPTVLIFLLAQRTIFEAFRKNPVL